MTTLLNDSPGNSPVIAEGDQQDGILPARIEDDDDKGGELSSSAAAAVASTSDAPPPSGVRGIIVGQPSNSSPADNETAAALVEEDGSGEEEEEEEEDAGDGGGDAATGTPPDDDFPTGQPRSVAATGADVAPSLRRRGVLPASAVLRAAELAGEARKDGIARRLRARNDDNDSDGDGDVRKNENTGGANGQTKRRPQKTDTEPSTTTSKLSVDEDVANVDLVLIRTSYAVLVCWILLLATCYYVAPEGSVARYEGVERSAALVELSVLTTAAVMKHLPLLPGWRHVLDASSTFDEGAKGGGGGGGGQRPRNRARLSGILLGGLVTQFVAASTAAIMVFLPVPVLTDPILGSRVHLVRWCEWIPLAGYMTLMTECIDAPAYVGGTLTQQWRTKVAVSALESVSTFCGLLFPFCTDVRVWSSVMIFSCVTYSAILFRYTEKRHAFRTCPWRGGASVDEAELYARARISLSLHHACCVVWTMITMNYFVLGGGPLLIPAHVAPLLHHPAAMMVGECAMDLLAKCAYMSLVVEAHDAAFDEARRANRRLAELRGAMGAVWECSSDAIAISVRKPSGDATTMVSPSFFRPALAAAGGRGEDVRDVSAIVLEHRVVESKEGGGNATADDVGVRIIRRADFADVDLRSADGATEHLGRGNDDLTPLAVAFADVVARAWSGDPKVGDDLLFEHDARVPALDGGTTGGDGGAPRTRFEARATRLEGNAVVVVVRDASERHRRFEAEKRHVFETTARRKDAEANRFTRHEVKNGLLAAIEICGNARERTTTDGLDASQEEVRARDGLDAGGSASGWAESMAELDRTLHEVLNIVLAETMARDVIHEMYIPRMERIDVNHILTQTRGFKASSGQFTVTCKPSPLPILSSDQGLFKCIHGNAIRNALKYGKPGGNVITEAAYDSESGELEVKVINLPGPGHDRLVAMGDRASELVFSNATRLHQDSDLDPGGGRSHSAGDGAWIIRKCARILGGTAEIHFEEGRTTFTFRAPAKVHVAHRGADTFHLPHDAWGIAIDDSKIQRKLLRRFFQHAGVPEGRRIILGGRAEEITGFVDFVVDFVGSHPDDRFLLIADENLEQGGDGAGHGTVSGSGCIRQIRGALRPEQERRMLALVRSANDSPRDLALYNSRAHGYMPKVPLRGISVRETVAPLWERRFPLSLEEGGDDDSQDDLSRIASIENLRDLTLISPTELLADLEQVDALCVRHCDDASRDRWCVLWDKLHQLKGDLKSVNVDGKFSSTIDLMETLRGENRPANFMTTWLQIRSDVVSFISQN